MSRAGSLELSGAALLDLAERLADAARAVALSYFRTPVAIDAKADATPVTVADREAEAAMRAILEAEVPDHGIYGEEEGSVRAGSAYLWVLDPIDGTKSFVAGRPLFGTLVALLSRGVPVIGVIDCPALDERWVGVEGRPTTLNGRPVRTRPCPHLEAAWMNTTSPAMYEGADERAFARLRGRVRQTLWGGDCYGFGLLAMGGLDIMVEARMKPYDYCALVPVVTGAGGVITDWRGAPLTMESDGRVLAAGDRRAHAAAIEALEPYATK